MIHSRGSIILLSRLVHMVEFSIIKSKYIYIRFRALTPDLLNQDLRYRNQDSEFWEPPEILMPLVCGPASRKQWFDPQGNRGPKTVHFLPKLTQPVHERTLAHGLLQDNRQPLEYKYPRSRMCSPVRQHDTLAQFESMCLEVTLGVVQDFYLFKIMKGLPRRSYCLLQKRRGTFELHLHIGTQT